MPGFEPLFTAAADFVDGSIEPTPAGTVALPSGSIIVCDPTSSPSPVLVRRVPPGRYPVTVSVATMKGTNERRIAAAMVRFSAQPIATWEPALGEAQDPNDLRPGEYFGYGVDGGTACFMDGEMSRSWTFDDHEQSVEPALEAADPTLLAAYAEVTTPKGNLIAFAAGAGDDMYASFWALDASGALVALVTEFRIVGTEVTRGDAIIEAHWPGTPEPPISAAGFLVLFEAGRTFGKRGASIARVDAIGEIDVPSGRLVVGAARGLPKPLALSVPSGTYPASLAIAHSQHGKEMRDWPGAVLVRFSGADPVRWEVAAPQGVDLAALGQGETTGLGYDADNQMLFIGDSSAAAAIKATRKQPLAGFERTEQRPWRAEAVPLGGARVAAIGVGGLGNEHVFWGLDAAGAPVALVAPWTRVGWDEIRSWEITEETKARARAAAPAAAANQLAAKKPAAMRPVAAKEPAAKKLASKRAGAKERTAKHPVAKSAAKKPAAKSAAKAAKPAATRSAAAKKPATKSAAKKPAAKSAAKVAKPAATKSAAKQPAAEKPAARKPAAKKPVTKSAATGPAAMKPAAKKPAAGKRR